MPWCFGDSLFTVPQLCRGAKAVVESHITVPVDYILLLLFAGPIAFSTQCMMSYGLMNMLLSTQHDAEHALLLIHSVQSEFNSSLFLVKMVVRVARVSAY